MLFRRLQLNWRYGVSELTIVVVGVLIALAADGWRQEQRDRNREFEYLQRLTENLEADVATISNLMSLTHARAQYGRVVLDAYDTGRRPVSPSEFVTAVEYANYFSYPTYAKSAIDDLTSTGGLRLIRSADVKAAISQYYATIDWTEQFSDIYRTTQIELYPFISQFIELDHRDTLSQLGVRASCGPTLSCDQAIPWARTELDVTSEQSDRVLERLLEAPEARSLYAGMARAQGALYSNLASIRELANRALLAIETYSSEGW